MIPKPASHIHKAYVTWLALVLGGLCLAVLSINCLVDPLWHFRGNQLTNKNFAFNERQAKLNLLLSDPKKYDCLIFGSSRATLLPSDSLLPHRCFNMAFSGGQIEEFIAFANYLANRGMRPTLIIVGVDGFNFLASGRDPSNIPDYIVKGDGPPIFLKDYLSMDSLSMSWRTLIDDSPLPRYYDAQFSGRIQPDAPRFQPDKTLEGEGLLRADSDQRSKRAYSPQHAASYQALTRAFPEAQIIAYVPPISAWHVERMHQQGVLSGYIAALYATARHFPALIDFSIPSPVTWRTDNTYDGSHYTPAVNRSIARILLTRESQEWGIDPKAIGLEAYHLRYQEALVNFRRAVPPLAD